MSKQKKSFADIIAQTQIMTTGLKNKSAEVAKRGIDEAFIQSMEEASALAVSLNNEQERLKSELKTKTEAFNKAVEALNAQLRESKKVVKLAIPQTGWREFGIEDKR